jgi:hypothetical protein
VGYFACDGAIDMVFEWVKKYRHEKSGGKRLNFTQA